MIKRTFWRVSLDGDYTEEGDGRLAANEHEANTISSLLEDGMSAPLLDLDCPHTYTPSSTPGHGHLLIDVPMTWREYRRLLKLLGKLGILEEGYVAAALRRKHNEARLPHVKKAPTLDAATDGAPF